MADQQLSLAETLVDPRLGTNARLDAIGKAIDWGPLERLGEHAGRLGRKPYRASAMIRALLRIDPAITPCLTLDETGATTKMARRHGRAPRGERLRASVPHGHWKTTTFIGGLRLSGMTAPMVLDGPMTGGWFLAYVEQILVPTLAPGDIVILDNLAATKAPPPEPPSRRPALGCCSCRPTVQTSIRSRTPSQSSRPGCSLATLGTRHEHTASCGRSREEQFPKCILLLTTQDR